MPIKHATTVVTADDGTSEVGSDEWNANHTIDTYVDLPAISTPAAPSAGNMRLWAKNRAGRMSPTFMGPFGLDESLQTSLFSAQACIAYPNTGTTVPVAIGTAWTARNTTGAMSNPAPASTNRYTAMRRMEFAAGAVAGQGSGLQGGTAQFWRGNAANQGGFFFFCRFGFTAYTSAGRFLIGLSVQNASFAATEPSTIQGIGLVKDSADASFSFYTRNASAATKSTAKFTPSINTIYDFTMFCPPNDSQVTYRLVDETNGTTIYDNVSNSDATLPANTTFMYPWVHAGASSAVAQTLGVAKIYCESDF